MNKTWQKLVLVAILAILVASCSRTDTNKTTSRAYTVMTYNLLCSFCNKSDFDPWDERINYFADIVKRHNPDLIGFQEIAWAEEVEQIAALLPQYSYLYFHDTGEGSVFGKDYPDATIFYKTDEFEVVENGFYWLSDTPDTPWTTGWAEGPQLWRLVAWAHFRDKRTGKDLYFATTHFDNNSPNQEMSAPLLLERTAPWAEKMPVIVVGDFNSKPDSTAYKILTQGTETNSFYLIDSFEIAEEWHAIGRGGTTPEYDTTQRIDHIFVAGSNNWRCINWIADLFTYGDKNRYPSDHFPIIAHLTLEQYEE